MAYAVVSFINTYCNDNGVNYTSEIPINWLFNNNTKCWWPSNNKNIGSLITRKVPPNEQTWSVEDVQVEVIGVSIETARKKAEDLEYSSDEANRGRGMRKIIPRRQSDMSSDDGTDEPTHTSKNWRRSTNIPLPPFLQNKNKVSDLDVTKCFSSTSQTSADDEICIQNIPVVVEGSNYENDIAVTLGNTALTNDFHGSGQVLISATEYSSIGYFEKIARMFAEIKISLTNIDERLKNLERGNIQSNNDNDDELIKEFLPLQDIEAITAFDILLKNNKEAALQFKRYIEKIGGSAPKDNISRIFKRVFTNSCAVACSWMGRKQNYGICNLRITDFIKGTVCSSFTVLKENEFEQIGSDWFRFAKQRLAREK